MVARSVVQTGDDSNETTLLSASMEAHAANGEWESVEELAVKLRTAVMHVPPEERRHAILALQRSLQNVQAQALQARGEAAQKLSAIRRGKDATRAYANTGGDDAALQAGLNAP